MSPPGRRLERGGLAWAAVVGAVAGYAAAAVVDGVADPDRQGLWTTGLVLGGVAALPLLQWGLVRAGLRSRGIGWDQVLLLLEAGPVLLALGAYYVAMWVLGPREDGAGAASLALVGVLVWPTLAGTLRIILKRPVLRPLWWAAAWLFLGVPATALVMSLRSGRTVEWISAVVLGTALLTPVAVWRYHRTRLLLATVGPPTTAPTATADTEAPPPGPAYANWGRRAAAFLIDFAIINLSIGVLAGLGRLLGGGPVGAMLTALGAGLGACLGLFYNRWYLGGGTGQTWGRRALGIRLVSERTGQPIGTGRALARDLAHIITDVATYYVGWLVPLWDAKRQTLADKLVHTVVLKVAPPTRRLAPEQGECATSTTARAAGAAGRWPRQPLRRLGIGGCGPDRGG